MNSCYWQVGLFKTWMNSISGRPLVLLCENILCLLVLLIISYLLYINGIIETFNEADKSPVFVYESTGTETMFRDLRDPYPRSRHVFAFHKPETLNGWFSKNDTLRSRLRNIPELDITGLRDCQVEAIHNL